MVASGVVARKRRSVTRFEERDEYDIPAARCANEKHRTSYKLQKGWVLSKLKLRPES